MLLLRLPGSGYAVVPQDSGQPGTFMEESMRTFALVGAVVILGLVGAWAYSQAVAGKDDRIAFLINQLGDEKFTRREAATKALAKIGEPALAALRKAAASHEDIEIRVRASRLVEA